MRSRLITLPAALAMGLAGCSSQSVTPDHGPTSTSEPVVAPQPATTGTSSAGVAASAPSDARPAATVRELAPGSTKGTISCGATRCKAASQACVADPNAGYRCIDWSYDPRKPDAQSKGWVCDDASDCPDGFGCCVAWETGLGQVTTCIPRSEVNGACRTELCAVDGAACPKGTTCSVSTPGEGACEAPAGPATCAKRKRCPADKPICALSTVGPMCVADNSPEYGAVPGPKRFQCTLQTDCNGGESCSFDTSEGTIVTSTFCSKYSMQFAGPLVCDPKTFCADAQCKKDWACDVESTDLPWLGSMRPRNR